MIKMNKKLATATIVAGSAILFSILPSTTTHAALVRDEQPATLDGQACTKYKAFTNGGVQSNGSILGTYGIMYKIPVANGYRLVSGQELGSEVIPNVWGVQMNPGDTFSIDNGDPLSTAGQLTDHLSAAQTDQINSGGTSSAPSAPSAPAQTPTTTSKPVISTQSGTAATQKPSTTSSSSTTSTSTSSSTPTTKPSTSTSTSTTSTATQSNAPTTTATTPASAAATVNAAKDDAKNATNTANKASNKASNSAANKSSNNIVNKNLASDNDDGAFNPVPYMLGGLGVVAVFAGLLFALDKYTPVKLFHMFSDKRK